MGEQVVSPAQVTTERWLKTGLCSHSCVLFTQVTRYPAVQRPRKRSVFFKV